jgi:hypothetical protein
MLAELRDLARTEPRSAARDQAIMLLALHGRAIISRRHYRARKIQRAAAHAVLLRLRASIDTPPRPPVAAEVVRASARFHL